MDEIKEMERRIAGLLHSAIELEEIAKDQDVYKSRQWYLGEAARKFDQAEWAERRLNWLRIGGK